jgi:BlaI family penicillinase repressor
MNDVPQITETEWEVMRVIWSKHPATAAEVIERLCAADPTWHPKTARTLLARLVRRKALGFERRGRAYVYEPLVTECECVAVASESFVTRFLGGSLKPMLAHFVEARRLTREDLEELRNLLENKNEPGKKGKKSWKQ